MEAKTYDAFISYASEDKREVAAPIAEKLKIRKFRVWLDTQEIGLGDRFPVKINEGLRLSRYGVAILSNAYFAKRWPIDELEALLSRETTNTVVLPVLHGLSHSDLQKLHPILATKHSVSTKDGIENVVESIDATIRPSVVNAPKTGPLVKFIMIRVLPTDQEGGQRAWSEVQPGLFRRSFEVAADPLFDLMVSNNSPETVLLLKAGIRLLRRVPEAGGMMGYPEPVRVQARLRVNCPNNWKRFEVTRDQIWADLPDPIEIKENDSPFRFTLLLENFCDVDSASSSEVCFCLETNRGTLESESITLLQ